MYKLSPSLKFPKAYPRHSVDIGGAEYRRIAVLLFSSRMLSGPHVGQFEKIFAEYTGTGDAVSLPSARLGLYLLLKFFDFPAGSEVIITPFTHQSIFTVIKSFPLKPVFVDIDEKTFNTEPEAVEKCISPKTKLIILTHMWGQPCRMDGFSRIREKYGLRIIEDCAMACGAEFSGKKVGSFFDAGIFSFGKAKALCTFGGGMLSTGDKKISEFIRRETAAYEPASRTGLTLQIVNSLIANVLTRPEVFFFSLYPVLRFFNIRDPYNPLEHKRDSLEILDSIPAEWKVRLTGIQAAVGVEQLKVLDRRNDKRIANAEVLNEFLSGIKGVNVPEKIAEAKHIYLYYALYLRDCSEPDRIREKLIKEGVDSQLNELTSAGQLKVFGVAGGDLPVFEKISERLLIIPNGIYLTRKDAEYVAAKCKKIFSGGR